MYFPLVLLKTMKTMLNTLLLLIAVAITFSMLMYFQQPGMIFYPVKGISSTPEDWGMIYQDVFLDTPDDIKLHGWYIPSPSAVKTVLFFHGNAGNISHRAESIKIFHKAGVNVFILDYRGYGRSEGKPTENGLYIDADTAWRYLVELKKVEPENIIIFGRSLGGAIAIKLASSVTAGKLIVESTFSSSKDMARAMFPLLSYILFIRFDFDNVETIKKVRYPVMVLHSPGDEIIPFTQGEKVFKAANDPKTFYSLSGDHNNGFYLSQPAYERVIGQFIRK